MQPGKFAVRVEHGDIKVRGDVAEEVRERLQDRQFFVAWTDMELGCACLEPWLGSPNLLNDRDAPQLGPGGQFEWDFCISIH